MARRKRRRRRTSNPIRVIVRIPGKVLRRTGRLIRGR